MGPVPSCRTSVAKCTPTNRSSQARQNNATAFLDPGRAAWRRARQRVTTRGPGEGFRYSRYLIIALLTFGSLGPVISAPGHVNQPASVAVAATSYGAAALPWLYWLLWCRACISAGCLAATLSCALLLAESKMLFGYSSTLLSGAWACCLGMILLTGLRLSYLRYLKAQYGWDSLTAPDRAAVLLAAGLAAGTTWTWTPDSAHPLIRLSAMALGLAV